MSWFKRLFGGGPQPALPEDFLALLNASREHLAGLTRINQETWRFGRHAGWALDQEKGILRFTFADGDIVECQAQAIGSSDTQGGSWMWL